MYNNNTFYGNQMMGQMYGNQPQVTFTQPLSAEDVKELRKNDDFFSLKVSTNDLNRAICTHKIPGTNNYSTEPCNDNSGDVICTICGARFNPDELTEEKVKNAVHDIVNVLESIKLLYTTIPTGVAKQFFAMIPFLKKTEQLYKIAVDCYIRTNPNAGVTQDVYNTNGLLNSYKQIIGGGMMYPNGAMGMGMNYPQPQMYPNGMYSQQQQYNQQMPGMMPGNQPANNMGVMSGPMDINPFYNNGVAPVPTQNQAQPMGTIEQQMANYQTPNMNQPAVQPSQSIPQNNIQGATNPAVERVNASATLEP